MSFVKIIKNTRITIPRPTLKTSLKDAIVAKIVKLITE
jgi:hypothetical protein